MPNERISEIGSTITIEKPAFNVLLLRLKEDGYLPIGPRVKDESLVYDEIENLDDLPQGYVTDQKPGHFRLVHEKHTRHFNIIPGTHSWKKILFPSRMDLFTLHKNGNGWETISEQLETPKYAFIGMRACELNAIRLHGSDLSLPPHTGLYRLRQLHASSRDLLLHLH
jgi:sulfhydrogenase subunit beta (sulfur reductase)